MVFSSLYAVSYDGSPIDAVVGVLMEKVEGHIVKYSIGHLIVDFRQRKGMT